MLEALDQPRPQRRRQISRLSVLYKINRGLVHCPGLQAQLAPLPSRQRRGHDRQFRFIPVQYRSTSFLPKTIKDWNCLPKELVEATKLDTFVSRASSL